MALLRPVMAKIAKWLWRWFVKGKGSGIEGGQVVSRGAQESVLRVTISLRTGDETGGERKVRTEGRSAAVWQLLRVDRS